MKKAFFFALAAATAVAGMSAPAVARDGCGSGFHRGPYGHCRPNHWRGHDRYDRHDRYETRLIIGNYYRDRGYWDGRRYWRHRHHDHRRGWRYY